MAIYIVSMVRKLVDQKQDINQSGIYTRELAISLPHNADTLEEVLNRFEESFLTTQFAKDGWVLSGDATVTVLTRKFYRDYNQYLDDDIQPQKSKAHLTVVR